MDNELLMACVLAFILGMVISILVNYPNSWK